MRVVVLVVMLSGCASAELEGHPESEVVVVKDDGTGKLDSGPDAEREIRVRAGELTLWMSPRVVPAQRDGQRVWLLRGRTSRDLEHVSGFVPEDGYGRATIVSARRFEIALDASETNGLLSGARFFIALRVTGSDSAYTAAVLMAPSLAFSASHQALTIRPALAPIYRAGLIYRTHVSTELPGELAVTSSAGAPDLLPRSPGHWDLDLSFERLAGTLQFSVEPARATATIQLGLTELALTIADPATVWPESTTCEPAVQRCLDALGPYEVDTGSCGTYRQVRPCNVRAELPSLSRAPENREPFEEILELAELSLPLHREVSVELLTVNERSQIPSTRTQVVLAYLHHSRPENEPTVHDEVTAAEVGATLSEWLVADLVPASIDAFASPTYQVGKLTVDSTTTLLLYFPGSARLTAIILTER